MHRSRSSFYFTYSEGINDYIHLLEVLVVTGGSSRIGTGGSQRLAVVGAKVIVLDIIPLTFEPGI